MGLNILELRTGRDVLLIGRRGTLNRNTSRVRYDPCSPSSLDRFLKSQDNLDKLRRLWPNFQPLPKMSRLTDQDLARMLKSAVGKSQVEAVIISTATVALPGMESQRVAQARKIGSGAQQRNRMQGAASSIGMQSPSRVGMAGQMASRGAMATPTANRGATPTVPIAAWPIEQRLQFVVERARKKVPAHTGEALKELVSPESIGLMVGLIAVGGLAQLTPVGWVVDGALIGLAFVFGGLAAVHALGEMVECFQAINNAKSENDLDRAADALSRAIIGIGLVALIALLHRVAKGNKGGGAKKGGSASEQAPAEVQQRRPMRQNSSPAESAKPQAQAQSGKSASQEVAAKNAVEKSPPPPSKAQLTDQSIKDKFAKEINDCKSFKTVGVSREEADRFLQTAEGQEYLESLRAASPTASPEKIYARAVDQISTFSEVPKFKEISEPLIKIVPKGTDVSEYSPFFTTRSGLEEAKASGKGLADHFGLPIKSEALEYDVFEIAPKGPQKVLVGPLAPTTELGGLATKSGGALQTVVPNRGNWSTPQRVGATGN